MPYIFQEKAKKARAREKRVAGHGREISKPKVVNVSTELRHNYEGTETKRAAPIHPKPLLFSNSLFSCTKMYDNEFRRLRHTTRNLLDGFFLAGSTQDSKMNRTRALIYLFTPRRRFLSSLHKLEFLEMIMSGVVTYFTFHKPGLLGRYNLEGNCI